MFFDLATDPEPGFEIGLPDLPDDEFLEPRNGKAQFLQFRFGNGRAEQRGGDHPESHFHHFLVGIYFLPDPLLKTFQLLLDRILHDTGEHFQPLAVETGLNQTSLPQPVIAGTGEQAVTQKIGQLFKMQGRLGIISVIFLQNLRLRRLTII